MSEHEKIIRGGAWSHAASCFQAADYYNFAANSSNASCAYGSRLVREKRRYFLRGGSWNYDAPALQSAHRDGNYPSYT